MRYFLLALLLITYNVFAVNDYDPTARDDPNRHVYSAVYNNQIYSPVRFFNNRLRYSISIDAEVEPVTINIGGTRTLTVNPVPLIRLAADRWNDLLASIDNPVQLIEIPQNPPAEVDFWITRADAVQQNIMSPPPSDPTDPRVSLFFARTTPVLPDEMLNHYAHEHFSNPGMVIANTFYFTEDDFNELKDVLLNSYTDWEVANIFVGLVIAHEFGHALGLAHPTLPNVNHLESHGRPINTDRGDLLSIAITAQLSRGEPEATVPIMTGEGLTYFSELYQQRDHRRINAERDIWPSELELAAINMENACGMLPSYQYKYKSNAVSSDTCKEKPDILYPSYLKLIPTYQITMF